MTPLEVIAVVVSFAGIWLTAKRNMLCWPVNFVACALYFKLFLDVRLYADMVLQALFAIAIVYGWLAWARGKDDSGDVVVEPLRPSRALAGLGAGAVGAFVIGIIIFGEAATPMRIMAALLIVGGLVLMKLSS